MVQQNQKTIALLSMLFIVLVWGSAATVTKYAVEHMPPFIFAFLRNTVASICLLPFYLMRRKSGFQQEGSAPLGKLIVMGLTGITCFYLLFNIAFYYTTGAVGALIQGFIPVAIILMAVIFLRERLNGKQIFGILLSVIGVILLGFTGEIPEARNALLGNGIMILAIISWGAYTTMAKSMERFDPIYLSTMTIWIGTIGLFPAALYEYWKGGFPVISTGAWSAILYLGIFSSAVCYILYNRVLKILPAVQVGNFMNLDPVFGFLIAVIFLKDRITPIQVGGAILVLAGVFFTSGKKKAES